MRLIDANKLMPYAELKGQYDLVSARDITNQPTVDAIPIEWLKNELIPKAEKLGATTYVDNIKFMLEDWEAWRKYR